MKRLPHSLRSHLLSLQAILGSHGAFNQEETLKTETRAEKALGLPADSEGARSQEPFSLLGRSALPQVPGEGVTQHRKCVLLTLTKFSARKDDFSGKKKKCQSLALLWLLFCGRIKHGPGWPGTLYVAGMGRGRLGDGVGLGSLYCFLTHP